MGVTAGVRADRTRQEAHMTASRRHQGERIAGTWSQATIARRKVLLRLALQSSVSACAVLAAVPAGAGQIGCSGSNPVTCTLSGGPYTTREYVKIFGTQGDDDVKSGGASDSLNVTNNAAIDIGPASPSTFVYGGISAVAQGGSGQDNANGGAGGVVAFTNNGAIAIDLTTSGFPLLFGIEALSIGGAADQHNSDNNSNGGTGGAGRTVTVTNNQTLTITGTSRYGFSGIFAASIGGRGGDQNGSVSGNQKGGTGGSGGTVQADNHGTILLGTSASRLQAPATGGGMIAVSAGGDGGTDNGAGGAGGYAAVTNTGSVQVYWNDTARDESKLFGIAALATGGDGLASEDPSDAGGAGGQGGSTNASSSGEILVDATGGTKLVGGALVAATRGGNGGKGPSTDQPGGSGGAGGGASVQLNGGTLTTHGDSVYGILAQSVGGTGGDGGSGGGLLGQAGGAGYGGDANAVTVTTSASSVVTTTGKQSAGIAAQSIGGGGGTGGDFIGVLGGSGGDGGRGGNAGKVTLTAAGTVMTQGEHAYGLLAQAIGGGGGTGGIATGVLSLGGDGSAGGQTDAVALDNSGTVTTAGYGAHAIVAQSTSGGGGAAGVAGGVVAIGGDGDGSYLAYGGQVTVTQTGRVSTAGDAAFGVAAQSIGGGGGAGAGSYGIYAIGGHGQSGGTGGTVDVHLVGGSVDTAGQFSHAVAAQSVGGGGGSGGDVLDFSVLAPTVGIGGSAGATGSGGPVTVEISSGAFLSTRGSHAHGIMAQSLSGGGGSGGDATGLGGLSLVTLTIGGAGGTAGGDERNLYKGGSVTITVPGTPDKPGNVHVETQGSHAIGVLAQSLGGGGGDGGNAYGFDASFNFAAAVSIGGKAGGGGSGGSVTVDWQNSFVTTGSDLRTLAVAGQPIPITDQATNAHGIVAQSLGGGGGTGGSATVDQIVASIPGLIPTINLSSAVGATGGDGGSGGTVGVTVGAGQVATYGAGAHAVLAQSVGGGGGAGGDGTALGISAAIPTTAKLPAINLSASVGGDGGAAGSGGQVTVVQGKTATSPTTIATFGDNANAVVAQSIGGGGGDAGVGSSATFSPGQVTSFSMTLGLGGMGQAGGAGGTAGVTLGPLARIQTVGSGSRGIVAQSIGGGGGTSQGGAAALYAGPFIGTVKVGRPGGGGGSGHTVTIDNEGVVATYGGDGDGILAQSIGGGGGLGGTFGADGSLDDPNWVDFILDAKHEYEQLADIATSYTMTVSVGGRGGMGGSGGEVDITNPGQVRTVGDWADGIVAQSIGGGGGVGGTAVAGGSEQTVSVNIGIGGIGGGGGAGGTVDITAVGTITTQGYSAFGLLAQSIGGGGGLGGDGSNKATGTITVGGGIGGDGGSGGDGGEVRLLGGGTVSTAGDGAHAVLLQSIGGGGGVGGIGNSQSALLFQNNAISINVGGNGGASGAGQSVTVDLGNGATPALDITTTGDRAFGLVAQSIGGGGGIGGGIASAGARDGIRAISVGGRGGTGNLDGGVLSLALGDSSVATSGIGSHAIVAQSIGGGGGIGGDATGTPLSFDGLNSTGSIGDGEDVTIVSTGTIATTGDYAFGILAQSIGGGGGFGGGQGGTFAGSNGSTDPNAVSGNVTITARNVAATGDNAVGIFAQSDSGRDNGTITVDITGTVVGGSGQQGAGVLIAGGKTNGVTVEAGGSVSASSGTAIRYEGSADTATGSVLTVDNYGHISGNILLRNTDASCTATVGAGGPGCAAGTVNNYSSNTLADASLYQAHVLNQGRLVVGRSGATDTTEITGGFIQGAAGTLVVDTDFNSGRADRLVIRGDAALDGTLDLQATSLRPGRALTVLTVDGAAIGAIAPEASPIYRFALARQGHDYHLSVASADFDAASMRLQGNQAMVASSLQDIWDAGGTDSFGRLFAILGATADQSAHSYRNLLQDLSSGVALAPAAQMQAGMARFNAGLMSCPAFSGADTLTRETDCAWAQVTGRSTQQTAGAGTPGFSNDSVTYQVGGQHEVAPGWFVGMSAAYQQSWLDAYDGRVDGNGDSGYIGLTVKREIGPWQVAGALSGSYGSFDMKRRIAIPGFADTVTSDPDVFAGAARLRVARTFAASGIYLKPYVDLDAIYSRMPGYRENGGGDLGLRVEDSDQFTFAVSPTLEVGGRVAAGNATLRPYAYAGVTVLSDDDWTAKARFTGAPSGTGGFDTSLPVDDVVARIGAGVQVSGPSGIDIRLQYDGEFSSSISSNAASLRAVIAF